MSSRWIAASVVVAFAGLAHAQSPAVLGRADADYAGALLRGGYTDLSEKLCALLEKQGNLPPDEAAGVKALHLDLRLDLALREPDLIKRKDALTTILQEKEDLVRQYAGRKVADDANATLTDVYQKLGETISRAIQNEKDPNLIQQLQKEGGDVFKAAESKLRARITELNDLIAEATTPNPKLEEALIAARYNLPRTLYFHALLFGKEDTTTRDVLLDEAVTSFQEFGLDYGETLYAYEGLIYEGLCYKEKENWNDALQAFDDAIKLRELYNQDTKGVWEIGPYEADLVSWGVLQKVSLLLDRGMTTEVAAEAKDYFDTTPTPDEARHGLAIRERLAQSYLKAGDARGASAQADKLVTLDPRGPWGSAGRAIQAKLLQAGGPVDAANVLMIAQDLLQNGDGDQALRIAHKAIDAAGKDAKQMETGVNAWLLIGQTYLGRDWDHEAALAFDAAVEQYGTTDMTAEAVYQSMKAYSRLNKAEKKAYYKARAEERQKTLATKFGDHPRAAEAQLFEADQLIAEGKLVEAAEFYGKVPPSAKAYLEAQFRAGETYWLHANELLKVDSTKSEGKTYAEQAERLMKKAMTDADAGYEKTMAIAERTALESISRRSRLRLAQLYLNDTIGRSSEVIPLLEGTDERFSSSPETLTLYWGFRVQALRKQGKLEDAVGLLDALMKRNPESKAIGPAAGGLATALDERADQLRDKENKPKEADDLRRKAATYYAISGRALLKAEKVDVRAVEATAGRLFTLGLDANGVPEAQQNFVGWDPAQNKETANWTLAAELLTKALEAQPGYKMEVTLGRTHGFLGDYEAASAVLGTLFDNEKVYDDTKKTLIIKAVRAKPELLFSYLEYGVAEHMVAVQTKDGDRFRLAGQILSTMTRNLDANSANWWRAKYYEAANLYAAGSYTDACFLMNDLDRTTSGYGKEYGLDDEFAKLKDQVKDKCK